MTFDPEQIVAFIRSQSQRPMKIKELATALEIPQSDYRRFRQVIRQLLETGELVKLKRNRIGLAARMDILVGEISVTRGGTGFVAREAEEDVEDVMIPPSDMATAMDGDRVMVRLTGQRSGRQTAAVIRVVERADRNIIGVFHQSRQLCFVRPDNPRFQRDLYIPRGETAGAADGEKVVAVLSAWDNPYENPVASVKERLGLPGDPGVDMLSVVRSFGLSEKFPAQVVREAEAAHATMTSSEMERRLDLTRECVYTIDPVDAKDHDDAVSVEEVTGGFRLGVHIADVSYFVAAGSELDKEAFERGNSVYLPGMVIPMLPEVLSNDVCSLKPNRKRLAFSIFIDFDRRGKMLSWRLDDTVIKSRARLSYEDVQTFFDDSTANSRVARVAESLTVARRLAKLLSKRRFAHGSLDFDLPEAKIILNRRGEVLELGSRVRLESHRLVEEFMLAANRAVALEVFRKAQPFLYRVHDRPDMEKLEAFSEMMTRLGHRFVVSPDMKPLAFARFLDQVKDRPESDFINELMLRSMQKAVYQRRNIGHFGLAFTHYTHFTSPIRRYPDLLVHRLLRRLRDGKYPPAFARRVVSVIDHTGRHCSETERTSEAAERQAIKVKQATYMARHLGDEFDGVISGVASYGFFVRLDNMGAEGLVRMSTIDDDYYRFDEKQHRMVGRASRRCFRLGDKIRVGVLKVDKINSGIDLFVVPPKGRRSGKDGRKRAAGTRRKKTGRK
ncbi:MAG: ribonuclease R [bacterium]